MVNTLKAHPLRIDRVALGVSNAWLVHGPEGALLVDTGMPWSSRRILGLLAERPKQPLCLIYITHAHIDHTGAAAAIRAHTGAPIAVHVDDAHDLAAGETHLGSVRRWRWTRQMQPVIERRLRVTPAPTDIIVEDGATLRSGGLECTVLHTPGHTPGSSTLFVRDPTNGMLHAFAGDLILNSGKAHVQRSFAVDWSLVAASVARLKAAEPDIVYPGHGVRAISHAELAALEIVGPAAHDD